VLDRGETLGRALRSAARIATRLEHPDNAEDIEEVHRHVPNVARSFDRGNVEILRANLNPRAVAFQHAVRLSVALVVGAALGLAIFMLWPTCSRRSGATSMP